MQSDEAWQQPPFGRGLDAIAVDLITELVQQVFADLDPVQLVEASGRPLNEADKRTVAHLIDHAVVELEVDFGLAHD